MLSKLYAKWMYAWETALTTRDTNRIVRPLEWGFDWLRDFSPLAAAHAPAAAGTRPGSHPKRPEAAARFPCLIQTPGFTTSSTAPRR